MKSRLALVGALILCFLLAARAEGPEDQYFRIYNLLQEADSTLEAGSSRQAMEKYTEALNALKKFKDIYPNWNEKVVSYRLTYIETKLSRLAEKFPAVVTPPTEAITSPTRTNTTLPSESASQLLAAQNEIKRLHDANSMLEAKLKEALSVQPAAIDPRELARAEERVRGLQKENELLKVSLAQERQQSNQVVNSITAEQVKRSLADLKEKIAKQEETIAVLQMENGVLKRQAAELKSESNNPAAGLSQQLVLAQKTNALLLAANEALRSYKSSIDRSPVGTAKMSAPGNDDRLRQLEAEKAMVELEKKELQSKLAQASPAGSKSEVKKRQQLEQEIEDLKQRLMIANRELKKKSGRTLAGGSEDIARQNELLRARLDVLEARQVPYTTEELALLKKPEVELAAPDPKAGKKSLKEIPPGAGPLVREAELAFERKRFDEAEKKYLQVLRQDEKNVYTLANLGAIQLQMNHLEDAEKNLKQAIALDPDDSFSLLMWGILKHRQGKIDEALSTLSRSAKLNPDDARTQNYLGITLSEKGLRGPAETALRRAIQLQNGYADAHHNLAFVYATHQPPSLQLAKWHYDKSLSLGHARNPQLEKLLEGQPTAAAAP
jgi:tetratricopeptide (TPR) repeat protein